MDDFSRDEDIAAMDAIASGDDWKTGNRNVVARETEIETAESIQRKNELRKEASARREMEWNAEKARRVSLSDNRDIGITAENYDQYLELYKEREKQRIIKQLGAIYSSNTRAKQENPLLFYDNLEQAKRNAAKLSNITRGPNQLPVDPFEEVNQETSMYKDSNVPTSTIDKNVFVKAVDQDELPDYKIAPKFFNSHPLHKSQEIKDRQFPPNANQAPYRSLPRVKNPSQILEETRILFEQQSPDRATNYLAQERFKDYASAQNKRLRMIQYGRLSQLAFEYKYEAPKPLAWGDTDTFGALAPSGQGVPRRLQRKQPVLDVTAGSCDQELSNLLSCVQTTFGQGPVDYFQAEECSQERGRLKGCMDRFARDKRAIIARKYQFNQRMAKTMKKLK